MGAQHRRRSISATTKETRVERVDERQPDAEQEARQRRADDDAHLDDDLRHGGGGGQVTPLDQARDRAMRAVLEKPMKPAASALTT